ncbi:MAG: glycosyltransferase family 4 protein [Gammaproteobacteria bacterium]
MKQYDYVFVLNDLFPVKYFAGGIQVIFRLANHLASKGYDVAIYSMKVNNKGFIRETLPRLTMSNNLIFSLFEKLRGSDYNYSILKDVDILFDDNFLTKNIFACSWQVAHFVTDYTAIWDSFLDGAERPKLNAYIIIQNFEDNVLFSGKLAERAKVAYSYRRLFGDNLKKIVISEALAEYYAKDNPLVFQDAIDNIFTYKVNYKDRGNVILFPLRKEESKGSKYMIDAYSLLSKSSYKFIAYGNMNKSLVPDGIEYHFKPTNKELVELYNQAAIFVSSSLIEGFALPVCEAMASGCAVITTDSIGIRDFCVDEENCLIVPIKNSKAIVDKINFLMDNEGFRYNLSIQGRITASKYNYNNMFSSFDKIIGE